MSWVKLDDNFPNHPKVMKAGPFAAILFAYGLAYCNRYRTDGRIPAAAVRTMVPWETEECVEFLADGPMPFPSSLDLAERLLDVGLWTYDEEAGEYLVHQYLEFQPSRWELEKRSDAVTVCRRSAGKHGGKKAAKNSQQTRSKVTKNSQQSCSPDPGPDPDQKIQPEDDDPRPDRLPAHTSSPSSVTRAPETPGAEDSDRELPCPLDLASRFAGYPELAKALECTESELREVAAEFVGYWSIGGGAGKRRSHWARRLREDLRRKCSPTGDLRSTRRKPAAPEPKSETRIALPSEAERQACLETFRKTVLRAPESPNDQTPRPGVKSAPQTPRSSSKPALLDDLVEAIGTGR